jgi:hypothetical protein
MVSWPFSKALAISYSTAEETIFLSILEKVCIGLLRWGVAFERSDIKLLRKK